MINALQKYNLRMVNQQVDPEVHKTREARELKGACQQFESILWAQLWKQMRNTARSISGEDKNRPWKQMEDLSLEMACDDLAASPNGPGLWKMLYDSTVISLAAKQKAVSLEELNGAPKDL